MNTRSIITTLLLFFLFCSNLQAQEHNNTCKEQRDEYKNPVDGEQQQTTAADTLKAINLEIRIQQLEKQLAQCENELAQNQQRLQDMGLQLVVLQQKASFGDTTAVRLANSILSRPHDEKRVDDAIMRLDRITTPELKSIKQGFRQLLVNYKKYYDDIIRILQTANVDENLRNPFRSRETAQGYIRQLRQTDYYCNVYNSKLIIPYLNNLIDAAIVRLNSNDQARGEKVTLTDLIPKTK